MIFKNFKKKEIIKIYSSLSFFIFLSVVLFQITKKFFILKNINNSFQINLIKKYQENTIHSEKIKFFNYAEEYKFFNYLNINSRKNNVRVSYIKKINTKENEGILLTTFLIRFFGKSLDLMDFLDKNFMDKTNKNVDNLMIFHICKEKIQDLFYMDIRVIFANYKNMPNNYNELSKKKEILELESYSINELKRVGFISKENKNTGYFKNKKGEIITVKVGDEIGLERIKVMEIQKQKVEGKQIIENALIRVTLLI